MTTWLDVDQARELTGLSRSTLQRRARDGELNTRRDPDSGRVYYRREQLEALQRLRTPRPGPPEVEPAPEPPSLDLLQRVLLAFEEGTPLADLVREGFEPAKITAASHHLRESQRQLEDDRAAWKRDQLSVTLTGEDLHMLAGFLNGRPLRDRKSLLDAIRQTVTELWEREEARDASGSPSAT